MYEELIGRAFNALREFNPELAGDRHRTVMRPPQILREGTKKTVFSNFMEICKSMHRQPDHAMRFLLTELGTTGSLDGQQRLIIKGRFHPNCFEGLLRRYGSLVIEIEHGNSENDNFVKDINELKTNLLAAMSPCLTYKVP